MAKQVKSLLRTATLILMLLFLFPLSSFAHPGNTAADGCHYCWTNCDSWGYVYGTRHCHDSGYDWDYDYDYDYDYEYDDYSYDWAYDLPTYTYTPTVTYEEDVRYGSGDVPYITEIKLDDNMYEGERRIIQQGMNGSKVRTYKIKYVDSVKSSEELMKVAVFMEPQKEIIAKGTKKDDRWPVASSASDSNVDVNSDTIVGILFVTVLVFGIGIGLLKARDSINKQ